MRNRKAESSLASATKKQQFPAAVGPERIAVGGEFGKPTVEQMQCPSVDRTGPGASGGEGSTVLRPKRREGVGPFYDSGELAS